MVNLLGRLKAVAQVTTDQPVRPGGSLGVTLKLVGDDGLLYLHEEPLITITDPAGTVVVAVDTDMVPGFDATAGFSSHIYTLPSNAVEGTYLVTAKCFRDEGSVTQEYVATIKCAVSLRRDVPWL